MPPAACKRTVVWCVVVYRNTCAVVLLVNPAPQSGPELCGELHDTHWPPRGGASNVTEYVIIGAPQTLTGSSSSRGLSACRAMLIFGRGVAAAGGITRTTTTPLGITPLPPLGVRFLAMDYVDINGYTRGSTEAQRVGEAVRRVVGMGAHAILPPFGDEQTQLAADAALGAGAVAAKVSVVAWGAPSDHLYRCPTHMGANLTGLASQYPPCATPGARRWNGLYSVDTPASLLLRDTVAAVPALGSGAFGGAVQVEICWPIA